MYDIYLFNLFFSSKNIYYKCLYIAQPNTYSCSCQCGWTGTNCDSPINFCGINNPCVNGGICQNNGCGTSCICPSFYTGQICESKMSFCSSYPCLNGASCTDTLFGYVCNCAPGYTGNTCGLMNNVWNFRDLTQKLIKKLINFSS